MSITVSIEEVQRAGITIPTETAVAIAQRLIQSPCDGAAAPPFGPPTTATVRLSSDGTVRCANNETTPAVSEVAVLLDAMLPAGMPRVPGGLRYLIARGLLEVDAPPFDSIRSFSEALARFEHGPSLLRQTQSHPEHRRGTSFERSRGTTASGLLQAASRDRDRARLISDLVDRWEMIQVTTTRPVTVERRRFSPGADHLRRQLRDADALLYQNQRTRDRQEPRPARTRVLPATAACLVVGVSLIGAGELMYSNSGVTLPVVARAADPLALPDALVSIDPPAQSLLPPPQRHAERHAVPASIGVVRGPASRLGSTDSPRRVRRPQSRGLLERLRLRWLKSAFTLRSSNL